MITFNNIVSKFEAFCEDHFFIKTFSYGSPSDVDLDKFEQYPLLHLVYTGGDYNGPKAKTYILEVYILSLPPSEADKVEYQKESISDAERRTSVISTPMPVWMRSAMGGEAIDAR